MIFSADKSAIITELQAIKDNKLFFDKFKKSYDEIRKLILSYSDQQMNNELLGEKFKPDCLADELFIKVLFRLVDSCWSNNNKILKTTEGIDAPTTAASFDYILIVHTLSFLGDNNDKLVEHFKGSLLKHYNVQNIGSSVKYQCDLEGTVCAKLSLQCLELFNSLFHANNLNGSSNNDMKETVFKGIELPSASQRRKSALSRSNNDSNNIQLKSKKLENQNMYIKNQIKNILKLETLHEFSLQSVKISWRLQNSLSILPDEFVTELLLEKDGSGFTQLAFSLICFLRLIYEKINPLLIVLLHAWCEIPNNDSNNVNFTTIQEIKNNITISSQRVLCSFHHIILIALKIIEKINNKKIVNTTDPISSVTWTDFISNLMAKNYIDILSKVTANKVSFVIHDNIQCQQDEYIESLVGALTGDYSRVYSVDWSRFVQGVCTFQHHQVRGSSSRQFSRKEQTEVENESQYLISVTQSLLGLLYKEKPSLMSSSSSSQNHTNSSSSSSNSKNNTDDNFSKLSLTNTDTNEVINNANSNNNSLLATKVSEIKIIFPDYGDMFIVACLKEFDGSVDRVIDALLSDNLPPKLVNVDRTIQKIWLGKGGKGSTSSNSDTSYIAGKQGKSEEEVYQLQENKDFKRIMKERVIADKRQWEHDMKLIQREYDDDYDDQFDEAVVYLPQPNLRSQDYPDLEPSSSASTNKALPHGTSSGGQSKYSMNKNLDIQIRDMKRLNQITKEDEEELKFWKDMQNTNHMKPVNDNNEINKQISSSSLSSSSSSNLKSNMANSRQNSQNQSKSSSESINSTKKHQQSATTHNHDKSSHTNEGHKQKTTSTDNSSHQQSSGTGTSSNPSQDQQSTGSVNSGGKHRTKKYDTHHQKDKAFRKVS